MAGPARGRQEREQVRWLHRLIRPGATVYVVGPHASQATLVARLVGPFGHVFTIDASQALGLDRVIADSGLPPDALLIDASGAEVDVLLGAMQTIRDHRPFVLLAVHGAHLDAACRELLGRYGYDVRSINGAGRYGFSPPILGMPMNGGRDELVALPA